LSDGFPGEAVPNSVLAVMQKSFVFAWVMHSCGMNEMGRM
jgi:hypothetical protein